MGVKNVSLLENCCHCVLYFSLSGFLTHCLAWGSVCVVCGVCGGCGGCGVCGGCPYIRVLQELRVLRSRSVDVAMDNSSSSFSFTEPTAVLSGEVQTHTHTHKHTHTLALPCLVFRCHVIPMRVLQGEPEEKAACVSPSDYLLDINKVLLAMADNELLLNSSELSSGLYEDFSSQEDTLRVSLGEGGRREGGEEGRKEGKIMWKEDLSSWDGRIGNDEERCGKER